MRIHGLGDRGTAKSWLARPLWLLAICARDWHRCLQLQTLSSTWVSTLQADLQPCLLPQLYPSRHSHCLPLLRVIAVCQSQVLGYRQHRLDAGKEADRVKMLEKRRTSQRWLVQDIIDLNRRQGWVQQYAGEGLGAAGFDGRVHL